MMLWLRNLYYAFPVQLLILHLRSHHLFLGLWLILLAFISGLLGQRLGAHYLFLDPEYLGRVDFWSFFFLGLAFGGYYMTWNLTTYLLCAHYFPFLASLSRPFTKFCLNNLIIPAVFLLIYLGKLIHFEAVYEELSFESIFLNALGLVFGATALILFNFVYFHYTNKDISSFEISGLPLPASGGNIAPGRRTVNPDHIKLDQNRWRVRTYLNEAFSPRMVRSVAHYDSRLLMNIFKQNHLNALIIQLISMILLVMLGQLIDNPYFRIPAAASLFILASIFTAILGALIYWFNNWWVTILILLLIGINYLTSFERVSYRNKAYGMDYTTEPATYSYEKLQQVFPEQVEKDRLSTLQTLNRWKKRFHPGNNKPKLVILCVSGGGLRSATWAVQVIQQADSLTGGRFLDHTVLITGASGGIMGTAYMRELLLRRRLGLPVDFYHRRHVENISKDILNSTIFTIVTNDLFLPWATFEAGGYRYRKDRGYTFEQQFNENTGGLLDKSLADYRRPEQEGLIPLLYLTPSIVNDARRMIISPEGKSYMMLPPVGEKHFETVEIDAVDFQWLFDKQNADNLRFLTALRMNATYPYILPNVHLPSRPAVEVMDAGFRDNYGILSATRFIQVFQKWIRENTSGVVLVQISTSERIEEIAPSNDKGIIESLFNPLGIAGQLLSLQEFEQDNSLGFIFDLLGEERFEIIRLIYRPNTASKLEATVSFHLTEGEKKNVLSAIDLPENQSSLRQLKQALRTSSKQ